MAIKSIIGVTCTCFVVVSLYANAALASTFTFQSETTYCISEISTNCSDINTNGLSGALMVDLSVLDTSGNGSISWNDFLSFDATNSVSSWNLASLRDGGVLFNNWMVVDFGIDAVPDYSDGWPEGDSGGESLLISGFGVDAYSSPANSGASSLPGAYCPSTGGWYPDFEPCPGGTVNVWTYGISADYTKPVISAVPVPAAVWLFISGLVGLVGFVGKKKA